MVIYKHVYYCDDEDFIFVRMLYINYIHLYKYSCYVVLNYLKFIVSYL